MDNILEVKKLNCVFNKGKSTEVIALKDVSFQLGRGECLGIIGESGSGKSTSARIITRLTKKTSGKVYINSTVSITANATTSVSALKNSQAGEIEMNGGTVRSKKYINNEGVFTLNGGTIEFTSYGYIYNSSYGSIRMTGGTITSESHGIENYSVNPITIEAGTITTNEIAISNMTNSNRNELIEIKGGTITSQNNVAINNIKGRSGQQRLVITGGTVISQVGIAVQNSAILTLGKDEGDYPSTTVPEINGKTYGVKNTGTFNFYDGIVKGETAAIDGTVTDKPYGYKVVTNVANTEAYLEISPEVDKPVILNGNNMDSLEIAMQTLSNFETKVGTIVLRKNVTLTETLVIPSDVTVTFVLQGHAITYNGSDATIENNGTLTIVDYQDPTESLNPGDASIVRNTGTGVAIENNGSLTLGASGGQVNADSPLISGGVTGNTPTIYDGKIEN